MMLLGETRKSAKKPDRKELWARIDRQKRRKVRPARLKKDIERIEDEV